MTNRPDNTAARSVSAVRLTRPGSGRARRGQILVIALLAISLMVGLVFLVFNTGDYINHRLTAQNVADSVAISGAGWTARSMNVIAMNNCAQSRMLALVPVFDALPLATEMALAEVTAWEEGLTSQIQLGLPPTQNDYLRVGISNLRDRMTREREILAALDGVVNSDSFDMRLATHWVVEGVGGSPPHGSMWQTAMALGDFSYVTWQTSALLAQATAVRFGRANNADVSVLLPLTPMVPAKVGEFTDFQPVLEGEGRVYGEAGEMIPTGRNGGGIPDFVYPYRLGPWAMLYNWRHELWVHENGTWVLDEQQPEQVEIRVRGTTGSSAPGGRTVGSSVNLPSNNPPTGYWVGGTSTLMGWSTYGPFYWARSEVLDTARESVPDTFFSTYIDQFSRDKMSYMFTTPLELKMRHYPQWIHTDNYPAAQAIAEAAQSGDPGELVQRINKTLYYRVEVYSSIPPTSGNYMTPGTFLSNSDDPKAIWMNGWSDAANWGLERVGDYVWRDRYGFEITSWPEIGIVPSETGGELDYHPVYVEVYYVWGGIDVGSEVEIRNPCNWDEYDTLPKPLLFDPGPNNRLEYRYDPGNSLVGTRYAFMGIVRDRVKAKIWPQRFKDINPMGGVMALAQSKVFNNKSWDLWTQDWQAQLMPVVRWDEWLQELETGQWELGYVPGLVDEQEYNEIKGYLDSLNEDMVWQYFDH